MKKRKQKAAPAGALLRLDLGCGINKRPGFFGVDAQMFPGVDLVQDLTKPWPWPDGSVEEINASHFIEHFDPAERAHIVNEMWRVLVPGGKAVVQSPYGFSERSMGDPTHKWPPVVGFWFFYLSRDWRRANAPHTDKLYRCNFQVTWGYMLHQEWQMKSQEAQTFAAQWYTNAVMDIQATMVKAE